MLGAGVLGLVLAGHPAAAAVTIHTPDEVLAEWTIESGGNLFFRDADGGLYEFITDIDDPAISNRGDGDFHPPAADLVEEALGAQEFPLHDLDITVFILPYPRRGLLDSSAGRASIYLSPGVTDYQSFQLHALVAHELGHVVHRQLMPDADAELWNRYRQLRGIEDTQVYHARAQHRDRPHEIFAEDYRFLFGGDLANYSHSIENPNLSLPTEVPGLTSFMLGLAGVGSVAQDLPGAGRLHLFPNPSPGAVTVSWAKDGASAVRGPVELRIYDARGALVASQQHSPRTAVRWGGRLGDGRLAPPGLYFVELLGGADRWVGKVLIAR